MKLSRYAFALVLLGLLFACQSGKKYELNHTFENGTWDRFYKLQFEMPDIETGSYNITLIINHSKAFEYDRFPVFVTLNTPSGEERMNEIEIKIKDDDKFFGTPEHGQYKITQKLWEGINIADTGACIIEIENLVPKIQTTGVNSVSVIMLKTK